MESHAALAKLKELNVPHERIAEVLGRSRSVATKLLAGDRSLKADELPKIVALIEEFDFAPAQNSPTYLPIEVLPTFAGAGGGGNGDGDLRTALVPRYLIEDELHGKPGDFLLIDIRGDSMEPDFQQGDQILIDKRDRSPAQPGPFALWDGEWGEYVLKNVERSAAGEVRIFSTNSKYSDVIVAHESTRIIGRPVWVGRRL